MSNNFNPGFDREKEAFLELANRGDGLTPIEYLYAEEARFGSVLSSVITGGTAELYTIYVNGVESSNITNSNDIITNSLKLSNQLNDYYVGFTAGSLTQSTIWSLPLQDGSNGQVLATNGNGSLSFVNAGGGGGGAPTDATYILQTSDSSLPNAQALNGLGTGIAKITGGGIVAIATPDADYATVTTLQEIANEAQVSANSASSSASNAASSANSASSSASDAASSANSASSSASNAASSANSASGSAAEATGYAAAAAGSAVAAAASAAIASGAASTAAGSAASASASASSASTSASEANKDADKAANKADNASGSADDASDSANSASNSANQAEEYLNTLLETGLNQLPCSGNVSLEGYKLIDVATPELPTDGANKNYIDTNFVKGKVYNTDNLYIGETAGADSFLAVYNLGIGNLALTHIETGASNVAIGVSALQSNSSGSNNTAVGYQAGTFNTANNQCVFLGANSDSSVDGLTNAIAIGYNSSISLSNSMCLGNGVNVGINQSFPICPLHISNVENICALYLENTTAIPAITAPGGLLYITDNDLYYTNNNKTVSLTYVNDAIAGEYILPTLTVNSQGQIITATSNGIAIADNFFIGSEAGNINLAGDFNFGYGTQSLQSLTTGSDNIGIGFRSLRNNTTGDRNVGIGLDSLINNNSGNDNTGVGYSSLSANQIGNYNTGIGSECLVSNQNGSNNTAAGYRALQANKVDDCTAIGSRCLADNTFGVSNTGVGTNVLRENVAGNRNTGVGYNALYNNKDTGNTALGAYSLALATTGGINTALGAYSLNQNITGISNVAVGYQAGDSFTSNNNCVFLGANSDSSVDGLTNAIAIGYNSSISLSNSMCLGNSCYVGINQASPTYPLHISNVNNICALYLENTTNIPDIPVTGGILYIRDNELYYGGNATTFQLTNTLTNGQLLIGSTGTAPVAAVPTNGTNISWTTGAGSLTANITGQIGLSNGGTNANLTASNGGIVYSTASALAVLPGTATAGRILRSGTSSAPSWSTATYPSSTTINQLLYSSATNVVAGLGTANNGVLITSGTGVPSISSTLPSAVQSNITSLGTVTSGIWNGTAITVANGGTGVTSTTAYGVVCGGTTTTSGIQNAGTGNLGEFLISNGPSALPSWKASPFAPTNASYIVQTASGELSNEQSLGALSTGILINTVTSGTGVLSIASAGEDYYSPGNPTTIRDDGSNFFIGTNAGNATLTGTNNTGIGIYALGVNTTGSNNTAIGHGTLRKTTTGTHNTAVGYYALNNNTTSFLTAVGYFALTNNTTGSYNTAVGRGALSNNTTGGYNTAVGHQALNDNNASNNTAVGESSLSVNTTGNSNVGVGSSSLVANTTGNSNVGIGYNALSSNTTGSSNTGIGRAALGTITTTSNNTAVGANAADSTTGSNNTAIGQVALGANITGSGNTALGRASGSSHVTYTNCLFLGYNADASANSLTNAIAIGYNASVSTSNSMVLGNGVNVGIGTSSPAYKLDIGGGTINAPDGLTPDTQLLGRCMLSSLNTGLTIANNSLTSISFNGTSQTTYDPSSWHSNSVNPTRIRPGVVGTYRLTGFIRFNDNSGGSVCGLGFRINGTDNGNGGYQAFVRADGSSNGRRSASLTCIVTTDAITDYFEMQGYQDSGGSLAIKGAHFQVERLV